jgi:hypothetical protein
LKDEGACPLDLAKVVLRWMLLLHV